VSESYRIRLANPGDIQWLSVARARMALDMRGGTEDELMAGAVHFAEWAAEGMSTGSYLAWIAVASGERVACAGLWLKPRQPDVRTGHDLVPYVLGVYCEPGHRRNGLARRLMDEIVQWATSYGFGSIELHTSEDGRALYEAMGFERTTEMRLTLGRS
jgi:GNAT superfamily N-acetyltransferase